MSHSTAGAAGLVYPREVALIDGVNDERIVVASANARFEAAIAKSDMLLDDGFSACAKRTREKALANIGGEAHCKSH
jgi:hypothetical protein